MRRRWRGSQACCCSFGIYICAPVGIIYGPIRPWASPVQLLTNPYIKEGLESIKQMALRSLSLCVTFAFHHIPFILSDIKREESQNKKSGVCGCVPVEPKSLKHLDGDNREIFSFSPSYLSYLFSLFANRHGQTSRGKTSEFTARNRWEVNWISCRLSSSALIAQTSQSINNQLIM